MQEKTWKNCWRKNGVFSKHMHNWNIHRLKFRWVAGCKDSCRGVFVETQTESMKPWPLVSKGVFTTLTKSLLKKAQVSCPVWLISNCQQPSLMCGESENTACMSEMGCVHLKKKIKQLFSVKTWQTGRQKKHYIQYSGMLMCIGEVSDCSLKWLCCLSAAYCVPLSHIK